MTLTTPDLDGRTCAPCAPRSAERLALRPLPLDAVRLTGGTWADWQRDNRAVTAPHALEWLERDGVLDNFRRLPGGGGEPVERRGMVFADSDLYKVLEGLAWDLVHGTSELSTTTIAGSADLLAAVQEPDGYLNTVVQAGLAARYGDLPRGHELYSAGHLLQAAVAHARVTGDEALLAVATRLADRLVEDFGGGRRDDTDGHPEIEMALVELYRHTGTRSYLDLARQLVDVRGHGVLGPGKFGSTYFQDDVPVREQTTVAGHAVRAVYLLAGVVDVYIETGDRSLLDAAERQWASMVAEKTYLTGAVGSRFEGEAFGDPHELPPDLAYGETCAAIGALMLSWRLLLVTGEGRYADHIERVLHNVFAASTSLDRDAFFYVNPVQRRRPVAAAPAGGKPPSADAPGTRAAWYDVCCCPPNIMRTVATLGGYVSTVDGAGVQVHQYLPGEIRTVVDGDDVHLDLATTYPVDGDVEITVRQAPTTPWSLALRIPAWSPGAVVEVAGERTTVAPDARGYHVVTRVWSPGDVVTLRLDVTPRLTAPHPAVDAVRGCVAVERGPVVYCLETTAQVGDAAGWTDLDGVELDVRAPLTEDVVADRAGQVTVLRATGAVRTDRRWGEAGWAPLGQEPPSTRRVVPLTLTPYALWANRGPSAMRVWIPVQPA